MQISSCGLKPAGTAAAIMLTLMRLVLKEDHTGSVVLDSTQVFKQTNTSGEAIAYAGDVAWTDYTVQAYFNHD